MDITLSEVEARVLGCLIEKETATPEYYPLTLNSLTVACRQKSNRYPLMAVDEKEIVRALDGLRDMKLAWQVTSSVSRTPKYRHDILARFTFSPRDLAVMCELLVRGAQTVGELRSHTRRLCDPGTLADVAETIDRLMSWDSGALVARVPPRPGKREQRFAHLFSGAPEEEAFEQVAASEPARVAVLAEDDRITALEQELQQVKQELAALHEQFDVFTRQFM